MFMLFEGNQGELLSPEEFMMTESVRVTPIDFGTDTETRSNQQIIESSGSGYTFLRIANVDYLVYVLNDGEVAFASNTKDHPSNRLNDYSDKPTNTNQAIRVFGSVLWVILELAKRLKVKQIRFSAASTKLGRAYRAMTRNTTLMAVPEHHGATFNGFDGDWFTFNLTSS